jgi:UDP:flavonoid glycosyltransferase YjiC (YdhE family)
VAIEMRILWAVSSVGKGHLMRDIAIVNQLQRMADVEIDWLIPDPGGEFMRSRGYTVLDHSGLLSGSGKVYAQVFAGSSNVINLMRYIKADTRLHKHDFLVSKKAWEDKTYDVIVGDEAFWLLTGFASRWAIKPAPFIFLTDFIGVKSLKPSMKDNLFAWYNNLKFTMSFLGPDTYIYIGDAEEIPDEPMGFLLPCRRAWARRNCRFVKPVVGFDPEALPDKSTLRKQLGLPVHTTLFIATVGPEGDTEKRTADIESVLELLQSNYPDAHFVMVSPDAGRKSWIQYNGYLDALYKYFAAADFVLTQAGYGKVAELSALGIPFIAIPLDFHFEQEYVMAHRLNHYGVGKIVTLRNHSPETIAAMALQLMGQGGRRVSVDDGTEVARIILDAVKRPSA